MDILTETKKRISAFLNAKAGLLWMDTVEEFRAENLIFEVAAALNYNVKIWSATRGVESIKLSVDSETGKLRIKDTVIDKPFPYAPHEALKDAYDSQSGRVITIFRDLGPQLNPLVSRALRDVCRFITRKTQEQSKAVIVIGTQAPPDDIPGINLVELPLPDRDNISRIIDDISNGPLPDDVKAGIKENREAIISASIGLPAEDVSTSVLKSIVETGTADPGKISQDKKQIVARGGVLEWFDPDPRGFDLVGGLANLKEWLKERKSGFSDRAVQYGLPNPKGILCVGVPGGGKSLTAKCTAAAWQVPLLRMDVGALYGGLVGESEGNIRKALRTAESVAPCVMWV